MFPPFFLSVPQCAALAPVRPLGLPPCPAAVILLISFFRFLFRCFARAGGDFVFLVLIWASACGSLQVGFAPRKLHPDGGYWNAEPHQNGIYNTLFPTKGAFLHKRFYELYWAPKLEWVRQLLKLCITYFGRVLSLQ